jgi:putative phage-type endonuclease
MTNLHLRKERLENITATEMSAILGVNPYNTATSVYKQKLDPQPVESIHLRRGHLMEPAVLEALNMDLKWDTERHLGGTIVMTDHRVAATPDAYTKGRTALIECKSIGYKSFNKWYEAPPPHYQVQVAVQMMVTGIHKGYIAALEAGDPYDSEWRLIVWEIAHNKELEDIMKRATGRFWDLAEAGKSLRAGKDTKPTTERVLEILAETHKLTYPLEVPKMETLDDLSYALSLFE